MMKSKLRDLLDQPGGSECICVVHRDVENCIIPLEDLSQLTETGREDFSALLDAVVETVRPDEAGLGVVISGVEPQELERFCDAYAAHMEAEQAMGPMM